MNGEVQDKPEGRSRGIGWSGLWWLPLALVVYVLSSGPALMMVHRGIIPINSPTYRFLSSLYQPLNWAANVTPLVATPLQMYWELWTSTSSDSKGKAK